MNYRNSCLAASDFITATRLRAGDRAPDVQLADGNWLSEHFRGTE
ncbi:hypothetical protein [Mucilaginibacter sp. SG564]|nr:hypothetical protein [Mucilaginibacter sp. SG564]